MQKLFRLTPLQDNFNCNFNVLIAGTPRVMGIYDDLYAAHLAVIVVCRPYLYRAQPRAVYLFHLFLMQDNFNCNFNVLIAGTPRVMGIYEILNEWTDFRRECVKRRVYYDLQKKKEKLHLLLGLKKILLDDLRRFLHVVQEHRASRLGVFPYDVLKR